MYDSESLLQKLLADHPDLLAGDQINAEEPRRWLLVTARWPSPANRTGRGRWSLDHLFLDQDAVPTLVEVKRSSDTRIRREVVGQMLDYAANAVVYWPVEAIKANFESRCKQDGGDPERTRRIPRRRAGPRILAAVKTNLQAGRVRLIFVADEIPPELRRIVEFLNSQMDPAEVLAIEVKQFVGENIKRWSRVCWDRRKRLVKKKKVGGGEPRQWDEASSSTTSAKDEANRKRRLH